MTFGFILENFYGKIYHTCVIFILNERNNITNYFVGTVYQITARRYDFERFDEKRWQR